MIVPLADVVVNAVEEVVSASSLYACVYDNVDSGNISDNNSY